MPRQTDDGQAANPVKRKRSPEDDARDSPRDGSNTPGNGTPASYGKPPIRKRIRESERPPQRHSPSPRRSPPRSPPVAAPRKRPGAGARIDASARKAAEDRRRQREEEERQQIAARNNNDIVSSHYNAVPQRGREWRKTDSSIRGLRSFNNWVKSALIQKFSLPDIPVRDLLVLDIGCGKGGDLQKWQSAPQMPALYVGIDPAATSIDQARGRYDEMRRRRRGPRGRGLFDAHFFAQDCFGESIGAIPIVQQVGFDPHAGPDANGNITGRPSRGNFDVVSMMFCLHYSYESHDRARGMLRNVAGALKKGGRFLGVMPNSDVLSAHVEKHLKQHIKGEKPTATPKQEEKSMYDDDWDPEKPSETKDDDDDNWDPEKPSGGAAAAEDDWDPEKPLAAADDDAWDPEKPSEPTDDAWDPEKPSSTTPNPAANGTNGTKPAADAPALEWGNRIYKVKFPGTRPLPPDGVFRPPYGWKYFYYLEEAVDVPEYVVPWEGFRALAEEYGLELQFRKSFAEVWDENNRDRELGPLADRMGVRGPDGRFAVSAEEMEAASFYHAFCFYKI
ncbi:mRNA capping enzyme, large subunit [Myriangium duriaei CBS 260.36]|uniref:mRNA cap guanine-N(7) methyltransferase n=1 Tax=Myriangium duriaei CBS 260.36 TaxID=1168546 RepID=A0A9P4MDL6_9PEZI|nr:mRNA capping enzyme, large subunit [Myriangium duriaei CBS 260.36]